MLRMSCYKKDIYQYHDNLSALVFYMKQMLHVESSTGYRYHFRNRSHIYSRRDRKKERERKREKERERKREKERERERERKREMKLTHRETYN